jgi:hypothetical protein
MDNKEIQVTPIWRLYEIGRNYHRKTNIYDDTDKNYRFYNGDQWAGAKLGDVEPVQKNFIKPIVKYKQSVIHSNRYAPVFTSMNYDRGFRDTAEKCCEMLYNYMVRLWELDKVDDKLREVTKDAAINDEGIVYIYWDEEEGRPVHEVVKKNDVYYGNENDEDIQAQPYILLRKRMPLANALDLAHSLGWSGDEDLIITDNDTSEESGEAAKEEVDDMVTIVYKMYKQDGTVRYSVATRLATIIEDVVMGIPVYPIAHMTWEHKEGSARGEGEVRYLIPNQIEVNKTEMRRIITVKQQAYPMKVAAKDKIVNPAAVNTVGGVIWTNSATVDDVHKIVGTIPPAQMSPDVVQLQQDLIQVTRDLAGAGDTATGNVNPEDASGRAILAVQNASQQPVTEQKEKLKTLVEDCSRIDYEYLVAYSDNGVEMEQTINDPVTGQEVTQTVVVPQTVLEQLRAYIKIEVTPVGVYDKFAKEQTLENLFVNGMFSIQRLSEFEAYVDALDEDSVAPKQKLKAIAERMRNEQRKIATIQAEAQIMQQRAQQFLMGDPDEQASQISDAQMQLMAQEQQYAEQEAELDEETAEAEEEIEE